MKAEGWSQKEAAKRCGLTQPRMNDLMRGKIDKFSLDALVKIAASLGRKIRFELGGRLTHRTELEGGYDED